MAIDLIIYTTSVTILVIVGIATQHLAFANPTCEKVYPSEYAYEGGTVYRTERSSAMCRSYPNLNNGIRTEAYTHCDGTQRRLEDSDIGSELYNCSDYYVWSDGKARQMLFIFSTRVNLTTITLHYYSDSVQGLPRLRHYAVSDDFNVWDVLSPSYTYVDAAAVPPDGKSSGHRNVSINLNFRTMKVLLYKYRSDFIFGVSEVEFLKCNDSATGSDAASPFITEDPAKTTTLTGNLAANGDTELKLIGIGIFIAIVVLLLLITIAVFALVLFLRKSAQRKADYDSSYSTLCRESVQQMQPQSFHTSNDLYDYIQLSPSTGQAEFISTNETANTNNPPPHQNEYGIHPTVEKGKPKSAKLKMTASTVSSQDEDKSTPEQPTYAVVNKKKKQKTEKESVHCAGQNTADQNLDITEQNVVEEGNQPKLSQDGQETATQIPSYTVEPPQELYTAVKKKPKVRPANEEQKAPPIPLYTVEELYTAVKKKPKFSCSTAEDEEEAPPIPAHTVEELYTAVQKKPKVNTTEDEGDRSSTSTSTYT